MKVITSKRVILETEDIEKAIAAYVKEHTGEDCQSIEMTGTNTCPAATVHIDIDTDQPEPEPKQVTWDDFLSFLESEGVLENYDKNMTHKKKEIRSYEHEMWLESSFVWRISPEGGDFWNEIHTKWLDHLKTLTND